MLAPSRYDGTLPCRKWRTSGGRTLAPGGSVPPALALPTTDWFGVKKDNQFLDRRFQKRWAAARQLLRLLLLLGEDFHDLLRKGSSSLLTDQEDTLEMVTKGLLN